jgi:hypothetical protein
MTGEPLMRFASHIGAGNAQVTIFADRIEWTRRGLKVRGGATGAVLTGGQARQEPPGSARHQPGRSVLPAGRYLPAHTHRHDTGSA